jgi:ATP-dependent RNA helicase DeaD
VQAAIAAMGIEVPTPIQRLTIQPVLDGRDVIAKAETGTGKTLAFGAPMIAKIDSARSSVLGLVLCPTRELAQQVAQVLELLGAPKKIRVALVVGGEPMQGQVQALKQGAQVVVGTPGRVLDLYGQRFLSFPWTEFVVLDEADEMLEIGFIDDVRKILSFTPDERQTLLFSATFPPELLALARESTKDPAELATAAGIATVKAIEQSWMAVGRDDRALALTRLIEQSSVDDVFLVFCDRRTEVDSLMRRLSRMPFSIKALHGGYDQPSRFRVMSAFRSREVKAMVATDVAARGLDVLHVTHVVNYGVPHDVSQYTHRIGRTGRAGRTGMAITLVSPENAARWRAIERSAPWKIRELPLPDQTRGQSRGQGREPERPRPAPPRVEPRQAPARPAHAAQPAHATQPTHASRPVRAVQPESPRGKHEPALSSAAEVEAAPGAGRGSAERPRRAVTTRERLTGRAGESADASTRPAAREDLAAQSEPERSEPARRRGSRGRRGR